MKKRVMSFGHDPVRRRMSISPDAVTINVHNAQGARMRGVRIFIAPPAAFSRLPEGGPSPAGGELERLADYVADWRGFVDRRKRWNDAPAVPCTRANVLDVLRRFPHVREQVGAAVAALGNA